MTKSSNLVFDYKEVRGRLWFPVKDKGDQEGVTLPTLGCPTPSMTSSFDKVRSVYEEVWS